MSVNSHYLFFSLYICCDIGVYHIEDRGELQLRESTGL